MTGGFFVALTKFYIRTGKDGLEHNDTSVPFPALSAYTELGDDFRTTTLNHVFRGVTLTLSQCMFNKTKLLRFSICPKSSLSDGGFQMRASYPSMSNLLILLCKTSHANGNCDHTHL